MKKPPELLEVLRKQAQANFPELVEITESAERGDISQEEAIAAIAEVVLGNPDKTEQLQKESAEPFQEMQESVSLEAFKGAPTSDLILYTDPDSGQARLNPLYEAALAERLQFDGDIPELRFGPLPEGAKAAVPVLTEATNPVAVGKMLENASERVSELVHGQQQEVREGVARQLTGKIDSEEAIQALTVKDQEALAKAEFDPGNDLEEYRRRELPMFQEEETPPAKELTAIERMARQEYAFRTIATTPGRRSVAENLWKLIAKQLVDYGIEVLEQWEPNREERIHCRDWDMEINGAASFNSQFSYIDMSAQRIFRDFRDTFENNRDFVGVKKVRLRVETLDTFSDRRVGWRVSMIPVEDLRDWGLG